MQNSYNLYGADSFEVYIEQQFDVPISMTELHKIEQTYIDKYNSRDENFGYNLMDVNILGHSMNGQKNRGINC